MSILNYPVQTESLLVYLHVSHTHLLINFCNPRTVKYVPFYG